MAKKRGRPPKFSTDELRDRLVQAGIDAVEANGVDIGMAAVNLDAAIGEAEVPRGSAYRIWGADESDPDETSSPQQRFRNAVLLSLLESTPGRDGLDAAYAVAAIEVEKHAAALESGDRSKVAAAARELMRVVGTANFAEISDSQRWRVYKTLAVGSTTRTGDPQAISDAIRNGEERMLLAYAEFFDNVAATFKLKLREPYTMLEFSVSVFALSDGLANRVSTGYRLVGIDRPTGPNGKSEPWSLFSIGFEALVRQFFEPIDPA